MMNNVIYSKQTNKAYYWNDISKFVEDNADGILHKLLQHSFNQFSDANTEQNEAWSSQIRELQTRLKDHGIDGDIIFEYDIIRLGKRIDVILLVRHMVFSLEFKNGKKFFTAKDAQQAEDYAIDIKNFHKESENLYVCPILVATDAEEITDQSKECYSDKQIYLQKENINTLITKVNEIVDEYGTDEKIDFDKWFNSPYYPTPTIISAAVEAYKTHSLTEIAHSEAGQDDIDACENEITNLIKKAKNENKKYICFVTGVPGAGKTLVGLDVVAKSLDKDESELSVYLSGNGPLVDVLREALKISSKSENLTSKQTEASINALIQSSFGFKRDNASTDKPTAENILIFDEAQRVWNKDKMSRKHKDEEMNVSEPHLLVDIMNRHEKWAVIVCLVGLGQDIYDGEVGINEWFRTCIEDFPDWEMFYSSKIFTQIEDKNIDKEAIINCSRCHQKKHLHLDTSIRSFRSNNQSKFIDNLLNNEPEKAKILYDEIFEKYPIYITRDIKLAKKWARSQVRGSQRCGVLASSGAQRLKPEGIYVPKQIDHVKWFLAESNDIRSSNMMEIVASEFKVQGLEIDWAVVCWDADLRRKEDNDNWDYYSFRGTRWNKRNKPEMQRYLINSYRVLLTRARQGMVLFVPEGVAPEDDPTRNSEFYDGIYNYLKLCGVKDLPEK